jgi:hypothetical protein
LWSGVEAGFEEDWQHVAMGRRSLSSPTGVFLYHVRKAGGTSLRNYCDSLAQAQGLAIEVREGHSLGYPEAFVFHPLKIHLTSLREPMARLKSSYQFEGRWPQEEKTRSPDRAKPFSIWAHEHAEPEPDAPWFLWQCTSNYYVKAFSGFPRLGLGPMTQLHFDEARRNLEQFEIVLITEWLNDPVTHRYLFEQLNFSMAVPYSLPYKPGEDPDESAADLYDDATLAWLQEMNQWDFQLYEFAVQLSGSSMT